jgi:hypothetical protein
MTKLVLIGTGEIEREHHLTRVQVFRLLATGDWPEPAAELGGGRVWRSEDVNEAVEALLNEGRIVDRSDGVRVLVPRRYLHDAPA